MENSSGSSDAKPVKDSLCFETLKSAYIVLAQKLIHAGSATEMTKKIQALKANEEQNQLALYYYHELIWSLNQYKCEGAEKEVRFTCTMDWKAPVGDFIWNLECALADTEHKITFPQEDDYPLTASILYEGVLDDFSNALAEEGIVLDALDDGSDGFPFILYYQQDTDIVHQAIADIGLTRGIDTNF